MISKPLTAFCAGIVVVVAAVGGFLLYDQDKGDEIQADAETISGDKKVSDDPTSGFITHSGQRYHLTYVSMSYTLVNNYSTTYQIEFDVDKPGILSAYIDNVQIPLSGTLPTVFYSSGHNKISLNTASTEAANSGINLVQKLEFSFEPVTLKGAYAGLYQDYIYRYGALPSSGYASIYQYGTQVATIQLTDNESYRISAFNNKTIDPATLCIVVDHDMYKVTKKSTY